MLCVAQDSHPSSLAAIALARAAWSVGRASLCKARLPADFTRAFEAAGDDEAAQFEVGVEFASRQVQGLLDGGVPGIHFYVLNKSLATVRVLRQVVVR